MDYYTPFITLLGWFFVYKISTRALKRSDITKTKDGCVNSIEEAITYIQELSTVSITNGLFVENKLATIATKLEIKLINLNSLASCEVVTSFNCPLILRRVVGADLIEKDSLRLNTIDELLDHIEKIESNYRNIFFHMSPLQRLFKYRQPELKGALVGLGVLILTKILYETFFK